MNCAKMEELIYEYWEGELDELLIYFVHEHLETCESCRTLSHEIKILLRELNQLGNETIPFPDELDTIRHEISEQHEKLGFSLLDFLTVQKQVLKNQTVVFNYIPGSQLGKNAIRWLWKGVKKGSGHLLKQGQKKVFARN